MFPNPVVRERFVLISVLLHELWQNQYKVICHLKYCLHYFGTVYQMIFSLNVIVQKLREIPIYTR